MNIAKYGVLRHQPYANRSEHINIGIVAFLHDGSVRMHFGSNLKKLRAFDPSVNLETVRSWADEIARMGVLHGSNGVMQMLEHFGAWRLSSKLGGFAWRDEDEYEQRIEETLESLVEPAHPTKHPRAGNSRLFLDLKRAFTTQGWMSDQIKDINKHKIVARYPILGNNVTAEFAIQNGALHLTETVDFRLNLLPIKRQEAMSKATVLDLASKLHTSSPVKKYVVVAGSSHQDASPSIDILSHYADEIFEWEKASAMDDYLNLIAKAVGRPPLSPIIN
ncbi:DUF3037 domain-containing protein [Chitiniphilus eburneus]|uniref:DUF3037 domain-containing protein n=1 Tax=Chitiniphilus eburneus TaxID=2571148 RepID=UPI0035D04E5D